MIHRKNIKFLFLPFVLGVCAVMSSCSTVEGTLLGPAVQSPSQLGDGAWDLSVSGVPGRKATLFADASKRPPSFSSDPAVAVRDGNGVLSGLHFGLGKGLSLGGGLISDQTLIDGMWGEGRFQIIGDQGLLEKSSLMISLSTRGGIQGGSDSGNANGQFGPQGFPWSVSRSGRFLNISTSVGYELTKGVMPYVSAGIGSARVEAKSTQAAATNGSNAGGVYTNAFQARMKTWGAGLDFYTSQFRLGLILSKTLTEIGSFTYSRAWEGFLSVQIRGSSGKESKDGTEKE